MTFDPKGMTVKAATELLSPLSDEELDALYDAELDGKGRKSLLDAITSARDDIREAAAPAAGRASIRVVRLGGRHE